MTKTGQRKGPVAVATGPVLYGSLSSATCPVLSGTHRSVDEKLYGDDQCNGRDGVDDHRVRAAITAVCKIGVDRCGESEPTTNLRVKLAGLTDAVLGYQRKGTDEDYSIDAYGINQSRTVRVTVVHCNVDDVACTDVEDSEYNGDDGGDPELLGGVHFVLPLVFGGALLLNSGGLISKA